MALSPEKRAKMEATVQGAPAAASSTPGRKPGFLGALGAAAKFIGQDLSGGRAPVASGLAATLYQNTLGSKGIAGLLQSPARTAQDRMVGMASETAGQGNAQLSQVTEALIRKAATLPEGPAKRQLLDQARQNTQLLAQGAQESRDIRSNATVDSGSDSRLNRSLTVGGQGLNAAATLAPVGGGGMARTALGLGGLSAAGSAGQNLASGERNPLTIATDAAQAGILGMGLGVVGATAGKALSRAATGSGGLLNKAATRAYRSTFPTTEREAASASRAITEGVPVPQSIAGWALQKGLTGSPVQQASQATQIATKAMSELDQVAKVAPLTTKVPDPKHYEDVVKSIITGFTETLNPTQVKEGTRLLKLIQKNKGTLSAEDTLALRRYLDQARTNVSFKLDPRLSPKQDAYRRASDELRGIFRGNYPEMAPFLDDYHYGVQAVDDAITKAVREGNQRMIGSFDQLLGAAGLLFNPVAGAVGVGAGVGLRAAGLARPSAFVGRRLGNVGSTLQATPAALNRLPRIPGLLQGTGRGAATFTNQ